MTHTGLALSVWSSGPLNSLLPASVCHDSNLIEDCSNLPIAYPVVWCFLLSQHPRYLSSHQIVTYMEAISQKREGAQEPPEEYVHCLITNSRIQPIWKLPDLTNYLATEIPHPLFPGRIVSLLNLISWTFLAPADHQTLHYTTISYIPM